MLSYFSPWPVHAQWYRDTVPPGHYTFAFAERDLILWHDAHFSTFVLRPGQAKVSEGAGLHLRCYINADGLTQFDATNERAPFEDGTDILVRYVLDTETWVAGPSLSYGSQVSVLLADLMLHHRTDQPERISDGEVIAQSLDSERAVIHVAQPVGIVRLIQLADLRDPSTGRATARRFHVVEAPLDGPRPFASGGALVVGDDGARMYAPDVTRARYTPPLTGADIPELFHELAPRLWADGEPIDTFPEPGL